MPLQSIYSSLWKSFWNLNKYQKHARLIPFIIMVWLNISQLYAMDLRKLWMKRIKIKCFEYFSFLCWINHNLQIKCIQNTENGSMYDWRSIESLGPYYHVYFFLSTKDRTAGFRCRLFSRIPNRANSPANTPTVRTLIDSVFVRYENILSMIDRWLGIKLKSCILIVVHSDFYHFPYLSLAPEQYHYWFNDLA